MNPSLIGRNWGASASVHLKKRVSSRALCSQDQKPRRFLKTAPMPSKPDFASLLQSSILSIQPTSSNLIKTLFMKKPDSFTYHPGQAIDVFVPDGFGFPHASKATFSVVSAPIPVNKDIIEVAVKATPYYPIQWMMEKAKIGDSLWIGPEPIGEMFEPILCTPSEPLVMIGAGIGITPILSIVQYLDYLSETTPVDRKIEIIHQARNTSEFLHWPRLVAFANQHPNTRLSYFASDDPLDGVMQSHEETVRPWTSKGVLNDSRLSALQLPRPAKFILCGPVGFVDATQEALRRVYDIPQDRIHTDLEFQRQRLHTNK